VHEVYAYYDDNGNYNYYEWWYDAAGNYNYYYSYYDW